MPKKAFVVYPRTKQQSREGLTIKGKRKRFTGGSFMNLDENDAREVSDVYGKQNVHVVEDQQLARAVDGEKWDFNSKTNNVKVLHNYNFGTSKTYRDAWADFEKRRKKREEREKRRKGAEVDSGIPDNKPSPKNTK